MPRLQKQPRKYTLCVPGVGKASSNDITTLKLDGKELSFFIKGTVTTAGTLGEYPSCVWLDIDSPTPADVTALASIFQMDKSAAHDLWRYAASSSAVSPKRASSVKPPNPTGRMVNNNELYLCWDEVDVDEHDINMYCSRGCTAASDMNDSSLHANGKLVAVAPWFKPSISNLQSFGSLLKVFIEIEQRGKDKQESKVDCIMSQVSMLHAGSAAVDAEAVVQGLMAYWIHETQKCIGLLGRYANRLASDTVQPVVQRSREASQWMPVVARCRKVALALLRQCQVNESVLLQLAQTQCPEDTASTPGKQHQKLWRSFSSSRKFSMSDVILHRRLCGGHVYRLLQQQQERHIGGYKLIERRFSIFDSALMARQRQRLLITEKSILRLMAWGLAIGLIVDCIELWKHLDNMNHITTPGRLYESDPMRFHWTVLVFALWTIIATVGFMFYFKRLTRRAKGRMQ
ncbi:hypothetical protein GGI12_004091 [Dipsacomyces acuminosporus]|nr:hypothetical protein GGI12_004091 [Dipsacomyces acuminosporus]